MTHPLIFALWVCSLVGMFAGATIFPRVSTADLQNAITEAAE